MGIVMTIALLEFSLVLNEWKEHDGFCNLNVSS